ncbi:MAG: alpha/beta hydrolase [Pseudomonadota bacterium]
MNAMTRIDAGAAQLVPTCLGRLAVREVGQGAVTALLWPSIFTDHRIYDAIVPQLAGTARLILIDGPGHGGSAGPRRVFSMQACATAMAQVMDAKHIQRAVVGGTSWGGMVGAELALAMPERVAGLVMANTPTRIGQRRPSVATRLIALGARWAARAKGFQDGVARSFFSAGAVGPHLQSFRAMLRASDGPRLGAAVRSVLLHADPLEPRLEWLIPPTLVIAGKDDAMYPLEHQAKAAALAPNGRLVVLPGRHISAVDAPDDMAKALRLFLADVAL